MGGVSGVSGGDRQISPADVGELQAELADNEYPYVVERGDNMWTLAQNHGYVDEAGNVDLEAFLEQNPHLDPDRGGRDPSLIYPGEVVIINAPENGTVQTVNGSGETAYQTFRGGSAVADPVRMEAGGATGINDSGQLLGNDGEPVNGWILAGDTAESDTQVWYQDGRPTSSTRVVTDNGHISSLTDINGDPVDTSGLDGGGNGWVTTDDTTESDTQVWYQDGQPTLSTRVVTDNGHVSSLTDINGDPVDTSGLDGGGNGWVTTDDTTESDTQVWYQDGQPTLSTRVVTDNGHISSLTDTNGDPVDTDNLDVHGNGWVMVEDTSEHDTSVWYENGQPTDLEKRETDNGHVTATDGSGEPLELDVDGKPVRD